MKCRRFSVCLLAVLLAGCGSGDDVTVYRTRGIVMYEGKPMSGGGSIAFVPTSAQKGKAAGGIISADGTFVMSTYADGDGSMAGTFRVVIVQSTSEEPDFGGDSDAPGAAAKSSGTSTVARDEIIPTLYADPGASPLSVTIESKEQNELTIELNRRLPGTPAFGA